MKKIFSFILLLVAGFMLASCDEKEEPVVQELAAPVITLTDNVVSWNAVEHAANYVVSKNNTELDAQTATSYTIADTEAGDYVIKVKAISAVAEYTNSAYSNEVKYTVKEQTSTPEVPETPAVPELTGTNIYIVGDSTACNYTLSTDKVTDDTYFYPRYGYATQLFNYFDEKAKVVNLALSGRSSKSFLKEDNYATLKQFLKKGDYLFIGFGHNDEKNDDAERFTDASKPTTDSTSFKYSLYENYIKLCENVGATAVLCTPIVRLDKTNAYEGSSAHDLTSKGIGDYRQAIIELGEEKGVEVIDLTTFTKNLYKELGYEEARYLHAMPSKFSNGEIVPSVEGVDGTHINVYGAKVISYEIAQKIKATNLELAKYVKADITAPTKEVDLVKWKNAYAIDYQSPNMSEYIPAEQFTCMSEGWYGTAFGDTGGNPQMAVNGFYATETSTGVFKVGQYALKDDGTTINFKGKIQSADDAMAFAFKQVSINDNFKLTATAKVLTQANQKQAGFGLVLRDDVYLNQDAKVSGINTNYVAAGFLTNNSADGVNVLFSRETGALVKGDAVSGLYQVDDTCELSIERTGQVVVTTVVYKGNTYTKTYTDFDFVSVDQQYMYIGMFAIRGTTIEFTNVTYTYKGQSQGA